MSSKKSTSATKPMVRVSDDFLKVDYNFKKVVNVISNILSDERFNAITGEYQVQQLINFARYTYIYSKKHFTTREGMDPIMDVLKKYGIKFDTKDTKLARFRVFLNVPLFILEKRFPRALYEKAERMSPHFENEPIGGPADSDEEIRKQVDLDVQEISDGHNMVNVQVNSDDQFGFLDKNELDKIIKKNSLGAKGFPGRMNRGFFTKRMISLNRVDLARSIFRSKGFDFIESSSKKIEGSVIFSFKKRLVNASTETKDGLATHNNTTSPHVSTQNGSLEKNKVETGQEADTYSGQDLGTEQGSKLTLQDIMNHQERIEGLILGMGANLAERLVRSLTSGGTRMIYVSEEGGKSLRLLSQDELFSLVSDSWDC